MPDGTLVPEWQIVVDAGKECGLEWAGDWKSFKEEAHFQYTGGKTIAQLHQDRRLYNEFDWNRLEGYLLSKVCRFWLMQSFLEVEL